MEPLRAETSPSAEVPTKPESEEKSLRSSLGEMIEGVFGQIKGVAINTTAMLIVLVTVFFGVTFTLMNPRPIFGALFSVVPERHHARTLAIMVRITKFVPRWAGAVVISMLTIGSLFFLLMWPIFGFADAIMLGLIAFLLSAIPFLGPLLTLIPALLLALGEGGMTPVWVVLAYLAVQALEGNVILPLIMSHGMKLHPVAVIFPCSFRSRPSVCSASSSPLLWLPSQGLCMRNFTGSIFCHQSPTKIWIASHALPCLRKELMKLKDQDEKSSGPEHVEITEEIEEKADKP